MYTPDSLAPDVAIGFDGEAWVVRIRSDRGFAPLAIQALELSARARDPGHPTAGIFFRLAGSFRDAMEEGSKPMSAEQDLVQLRIATALERIADALVQPVHIDPGHMTLRVDGRELASTVVNYTLQQAARGPSSLIGGSLSESQEGPHAP